MDTVSNTVAAGKWRRSDSARNVKIIVGSAISVAESHL